MAIHQNCHLIAVIGGKGGVGKSVFAANLGLAFIKEMRSKALLIDLDSRSCGDQNFILGLRPQKTVNDIANFNGAITQKTLPSLVTSHSSGLEFIGAVQTADQIMNPNIDLFKKQLSSISQFYNYIIVDLGSTLSDLQLSVVDDASAVLVITSPEVLVVNQTKKMMNDLVAATVPTELIQLVVNKVTKNGMAPQTISQSLRRPVIGMIPQDDNTAMACLQRSTPFVIAAPNTQITGAYHAVVRKLNGGILQQLKAISRPKPSRSSSPGLTQTGAQKTPAVRGRSAAKAVDPLTQLKMQIHSELIREMDLKKDLTNTKGDPEKERQLRQKTQQVISRITDKLGNGLSRDERSKVIKEVLDESLGLGPLEALLEDSQVTEIMVNGHDHIYVERSGKLTLSPVTFTSNLQLRNVIERIVTPLGRRIDEKSPYVDARLPDSSRVNAIIEPLAIDGPSLTIRKFPEERITADDYVNQFRSLTQPMVDFLKICVEQGLNIVISGGTGSGKTTLLNVLSSFIPTNERIITVEDAAELQLKQDHVVRLETRPPNMEGSGEVSIRDLIRNSLRMRPDRIVVGECRDGAALDMLAAMNTGHDGSMTTVHANNPREAISRLETLCLMAGMDLPVRAIREQIAGAVNLIVQIGRLSDGSRKVKSITEVVGMQGDTVTLQEVFRFKEEGFDKNRRIIGQFQAMGLIPTFIEKFEQRGIAIPRDLFTTNTTAGISAQTENKKPKTASLKRRPQVNRSSSKIKKVSGDDS